MKVKKALTVVSIQRLKGHETAVKFMTVLSLRFMEPLLDTKAGIQQEARQS